MKKILILASNPRKDLNLDREIRELKDVIERSRYREEFEVEDALAVRVGDLQELLLQHQPQIVHFCGHGGGQSGLVLEGNMGGEQWVQTDALRDLFRLFSSQVQCVLLNACYSDEQADEIVQHIDYVIGMDQEIRDDAAIAFSKGFYRALGYGCEVEEAYAFGCNAIQLEISNRANVRSRAAELTRSAEVLQVVKQTVIPEHIKPMLKKRAGQLLANALNAGASTLPPAKKAEIQLQIAQAVTAIPDPPPPTNRSNLPMPQGLLSPTPTRRVTPLLMGGILIGLLSMVGSLIYRASTEKPTALPEPRPSSMSSPIVKASEEKPDPSLSDADLLERAEKLASQGELEAAIGLLQQIPTGSAVAQQVPSYLNAWSNQLYEDAKSNYEQGKLEEALGQARGIPETSKRFDLAQRSIADWQSEQETFNRIITVLDTEWDVKTATRESQKLKNPVLIQKANARIQETEAKSAATDAQKQAEAEAQRLAAWRQYSTLSDQPLDVKTLEGKSALELDILRNSIFAKYGLKFERSDLQDAFTNQPWYQASDRSVDEILQQFSEQERQNFQTVCTFQKEKNWTLSPDLQCL